MVAREGKVEEEQHKMPPQSQIQQFKTQVTVALKRKIEGESPAVVVVPVKKRTEGCPPPPPTHPVEFSPPRVTEFPPTPDMSPLRDEESADSVVPVAKRKLEDPEDAPTKKLCNEDARPPSTLEDPLILPLNPCAGQQDENKENLHCLKSIAENQNFDSILAKTLLAARAGAGARGSTDQGAKVVVEHQDLPAIYELGKELCSLEDDEEDEDEDSSMFDTPPKHQDRLWSTAGMSGTTTSPPVVSTYQFLDQNNQRIECDENGKSYLQLGTVNHHHLPVTPVIQPKPTTLTPRRPIPSCRPALPPRPANPTPPCDEARHLSPPRSCGNNSCYRQQRSDMLSLSLHKLHMARQRSDSSLRRSVLICNMLRYIEEESNTEQQRQQEVASSYPQEPTYWSNQHFAPPPAPPTPNPYRDNNSFNNQAFDAPLKDFNSAFRQSSPADSEAVEEDRGINWSSVLSLSSQTELDPLNNNTFSEPVAGIWASTGGGGGSGDLVSDLDLSQNSFDDISWKLSPISADEVMKAFPEENMFECAA